MPEPAPERSIAPGQILEAGMYAYTLTAEDRSVDVGALRAAIAAVRPLIEAECRQAPAVTAPPPGSVQVDDVVTTHHERAAALAAVLAPHRLKRVHKDRDDIYRARCLCDWPGSPWERREGAVAEHERHVAAEVLAAQEGPAER